MAEAPASFDTIFCGAIEIGSPQQRAEFIADACGANVELRARVEKMVAAHFRAGGFLESPAASPVVATADQTTETPGAVIGPYKLLQQIGEGGMGVVWMAEQTQPVQRKVALKVIKPGMDSRQVIARFEAERQALAMMDHVNIARVFDGGMISHKPEAQPKDHKPEAQAKDQQTAPSLALQACVGRPYFVMELVHGVPITKYCDDNHLTPRERLELFVPVCQAIQHAHQKGIIHRDIKPSNVMVTLYDGKPVPKVIDFGVAKATEQKLTERTLFTQYGTMVGTLEYMSPEQAEMSALGVDTRSDIYSLGVLLYELLTGSTPLTHKRMKEAAYAEILRMIKEEEPPKPSTRLSDSGEALASISANRHMEPAKLTKLVRGELDWIVMKTLEKDRNRRYETASGFAADVQRYLADEPVQACPPSAGYRLRKFARRNRSGLAVVGMVLIFVVLLGGGVGWAWRDRAARAAERANDLERAVERAELLHLEGKRGEALAALERAQLLVREASPAARMAERIDSLQHLLEAEGRDKVFVAQFEAIRHEVETEVDREAGTFSNYNKGYPAIRAALEHYGIIMGVTPPAAAVTHIQQRPPAIQAVVVAALNECVGHALRDSHTRDWLIGVLEKADSDPWRSKVRRAWKQPATLEAIAKGADVRQQPPSFLLLVVKALPIESPNRWDLARRVQFAYPGDFWANHGLAWDLGQAGKNAEAIRYFTAALALRPDNPGVLLNRSNVLKAAGELEAAVADLRRAIVVSPRYASAHNNLGRALTEQGKLDEAVEACRTAIKLKPNDGGAHNSLGIALREQGKLAEAVEAYRTAIKLKPDFAAAHTNLGLALTEQGKLDEAVEACRTAIKLKPDLAEAHGNLGLALREQGKLVEAVEAHRTAIKLKPDFAGHHYNLGHALRAQKKLAEAEVAYRAAIKLKPDFAKAHTNLGCALWEQGKLVEAVEAHRTAVKFKPDLAAAHYNLGNALFTQKKVADAMDAYRTAIKLSPDDAQAHAGLGHALQAQGKLAEAVDALRTAIRLKPDYSLAYARLGNVLQAQSKLADAEDAYRTAIKLSPDLAEAHYNLGNALLAQKKLAEAEVEYRAAIKLKPDDAEAHNNLGVVVSSQGKLAEAVDAYRTAIKHNPRSVTAHANLARVLKVQGKLDEAIAAFRKAIDLDPNNNWNYIHLGDALRDHEKLPEAITAYRKVIERNPNSAVALGRLAHLLVTCSDLKLRDPTQAVALAKKAVDVSPKDGLIWQTLAWAHYRNRDYKAAIAALDKVRELGSSGDSYEWFFLAMAHEKLGEKDKAREWYDRAVQWMEKYQPNDVELGRYRAEATQLLGVKEKSK